MALLVGLNGAGRIGRALIRLLHDDEAVRIHAINDVAEPAVIAGLLRHDSLYGPFPADVSAGESGGAPCLVVGGREIFCGRASSPIDANWSAHDVDVIVEATGRFARGELARRHLGGSVTRVLVTAVCPGADRTIVLGIQDGLVGDDTRIVSTASCTTHAAALPLAALDHLYGVTAGQMTTIHCTTGSQLTSDGPHADPRRSRSCLVSMIPTTTSARFGLSDALPGLGDRVSCLAVRVPTATVSLVELVLETRDRLPSTEELAGRLRQLAEGPLDGLLGVTDEPLVSIDFSGDPRSSIVDLLLLEAPGPRLVRVIAWYDNEWGYASRVAELLRIWAGSTPPRAQWLEANS